MQIWKATYHPALIKYHNYHHCQYYHPPHHHHHHHHHLVPVVFYSLSVKFIPSTFFSGSLPLLFCGWIKLHILSVCISTSICINGPNHCNLLFPLFCACYNCIHFIILTISVTSFLILSHFFPTTEE